MLARVAVMESDSASETESVTEITPPKKIKQSTIVGLFGPQPASNTSTLDSESADTVSRDIEQLSIITALYTGLTITYSLANLLWL